MKKFFVIFSVLTIMALSTLTASAISGNGTEESPFLITNQEELLLVTDFPSSHFKLANDIVMSEEFSVPLCYESEGKTFIGTFDGNGHTISNLKVEHVYEACNAALFYRNGGTIYNLNIIPKSMDESSNAGIAAYNDGTISNCSVVWRNYIYHDFGGITLDNSGIIENCEIVLEAESKNVSYAAGISRYNSGSILNCKVLGNISAEDEAAGISTENTGTIENSYFIGELSGDTIAGICVENESEVEDCYFIGTLSGNKVSGMCAQNGYYSSHTINGEKIERRISGTIKNCYVVASFKNATEKYPVAYNVQNSNSTIESCYYDKTVSGLNSTTYGTPKSTTAMKMLQTYQNTWDFDTVWGIDENINNGYPYLLWEYAPTDNQITFDTETQKAKIYLKEAGTYTVIFADYDGTMFNEADIQPLTLKQGYNNIPTTLTLTDGDKVFLWKDLKTLVPICEAANVSSK